MIAFIKKVVIKTIARFPFYLIFLIFLFLYAEKKALSNDFRIIGNWFHEDMMVSNSKKYHYMCFRPSAE